LAKQNPIGKQLHIGGISKTRSPWVTFVGVVGGIKQYAIESEARIAYYLLKHNT
jgi:hypothetical protein